MSDYKPITGELRSMMFNTESEQGTPMVELGKYRFTQLCDAIDAIHAQLERENAELKAKLDRVHGEQEDRKSCIYYDSKRNYCSWHDIDTDGLVELPKDADMEHICAGDKLDGYGKTIEVVELRYGRSGWVLISRDGNAYADTFAFTHHRPDTWERIIEDARTCTGSTGSYTSVPTMRWTNEMDALVARCKALAGDSE